MQSSSNVIFKVNGFSAKPKNYVTIEFSLLNYFSGISGLFFQLNIAANSIYIFVIGALWVLICSILIQVQVLVPMILFQNVTIRNPSKNAFIIFVVPSL